MRETNLFPVMQRLAARLIRWVIRLVQMLPLPVVARLGRAGGSVAWYLSPKHKQVALENLTAVFPDKSGSEISVIARENLKRIGENYASALKTASMPTEELRKVCEVKGLENLPDFTSGKSPRNCIVAIGHFGNFELYAILAKLVPGVFPAATYRGLNQPAFNEIMVMLREKSGCRFYERRTEAAALREALNRGGVLLGLLVDQHGGRGGVWGDFLGRECSTTPAAVLLARRYAAPLYTAICYRVGLGRWRLEIGRELPMIKDGAPLEVEDIVREMNAALETAVRRDPANWFWVHKRWKRKKVSAGGAGAVPPGDPEEGAETL